MKKHKQSRPPQVKGGTGQIVVINVVQREHGLISSLAYRQWINGGCAAVQGPSPVLGVRMLLANQPPEKDTHICPQCGLSTPVPYCGKCSLLLSDKDVIKTQEFSSGK